jgi:hypothetical protein
MIEKMDITRKQESDSEDFTTFLDNLDLGIRANNYARKLIPHIKTKQEFLDLSFTDLADKAGWDRPGMNALQKELKEKGIQSNAL